MSSYIFPGHPGFLESAAAELGHPESAALAGRIVPLTALANLCAQAALAEPSHVAGILAKAAEFRDQIAVALLAAERMLAAVGADRDHPSDPGASGEPSTSSSPAPDARKARKAPATPRDLS